jgi:hypothetical protein
MALKKQMVTKTGMVVFGNGFYIGSSSLSALMVGDIHKKGFPKQTISVVARQMGDSLSAYMALTGESVLLG